MQDRGINRFPVSEPLAHDPKGYITMSSNFLDQQMEKIAAFGGDVDKIEVPGGTGGNGASFVLVPGDKVNVFGIYDADTNDDSKKWSARTDVRGGLLTDSVTLIDAEVNRRVRGGKENATDPNATTYLGLQMSLVLGENTVLGTVNADGEFTVHPRWHMVAAKTKIFEVSISATAESVKDLRSALDDHGFQPSPGSTLKAPGQKRIWSLSAANSGGRGKFGEKIDNGLHIVSASIGGNSKDNTGQAFTSRDPHTNFERTLGRLLAAYLHGMEHGGEDEAKAMLTKVGRLGVLSGTNWGPYWYPERAPFGDGNEYAARSGLYEMEFKGQFDTVDKIRFVADRPTEQEG